MVRHGVRGTNSLGGGHNSSSRWKCKAIITLDHQLEAHSEVLVVLCVPVELHMKRVRGVVLVKAGSLEGISWKSRFAYLSKSFPFQSPYKRDVRQSFTSGIYWHATAPLGEINQNAQPLLHWRRWQRVAINASWGGGRQAFYPCAAQISANDSSFLLTITGAAADDDNARPLLELTL